VKHFYLISGVAISMLFVVAGMVGWQIIDLAGVAHAKPTGPGQYHK
jgi:hypothetical protein